MISSMLIAQILHILHPISIPVQVWFVFKVCKRVARKRRVKVGM